VRRLRPALSREAALDRIVQLVRRDAPAAGEGRNRLHVAALHALAREVADDLLARITATDDVATAFVGEFGPVMVVHTGPGLAGLAWWWERQP
jgi:fatty acid-binding protein DegV